MVAQYATKENNGWHVLGGYPGVLYPPYYWWLAGAMFGTLLDYWHYTGDDQYNDMMREGMIHQFGEKHDLVRVVQGIDKLRADIDRCPTINRRMKATTIRSFGHLP